MGKKVHDDVLDGALSVLRTTVTRMTACAGEPASYAEANVGGGKFLADVTMSSSDFTISDGDASGRKVRTAQKTGVTIDHNGTVDHVALLDTANSKLLYVTTCATQVLTAGNTMTFNAWDIELADPS